MNLSRDFVITQVELRKIQIKQKLLYINGPLRLKE